MFRSAVIRLLFLLPLGACGEPPPAQLPAIPPVDTAGFLPVVREQLEQALDAAAGTPQNADAAGTLGMLYLAYAQHHAAVAAFDRASLLDPGNFAWKYLYAEALRQEGLFAEAAVALERALELQPGDVHARHRLGIILMHLDRTVEAIDTLEAVVNEHPDFNEGRLALAQAYLQTGDADAAISHLDRLVARSPPSGPPYYALAQAWRLAGDDERSGEYAKLFERYRNRPLPGTDPLLRRVQDLDKSGKPLLREAQRLDRAGLPRAAIAALQQALQADPGNQQIHVALVGAYASIGEFAKAEEHFERALQAGPPTAVLMRSLGRARLHADRLGEAEEALNHALELNAEDALARTWLGVVRIRQGRRAEAERLFRDALALGPHEVIPRRNLALLLVQDQRHEEALEHLLVLAELGAGVSDMAWRLAGRAYLALGEPEQARDAFERGIAAANASGDRMEAERGQYELRQLR